MMHANKLMALHVPYLKYPVQKTRNVHRSCVSISRMPKVHSELSEENRALSKFVPNRMCLRRSNLLRVSLRYSRNGFFRDSTFPPAQGLTAHAHIYTHSKLQLEKIHFNRLTKMIFARMYVQSWCWLTAESEGIHIRVRSKSWKRRRVENRV